MGEQEAGAMRQGTGSAAARGGRDATEAEGQPSSPHDIDAAERRLPPAMPLHAITALHGEAGLRERFAIETATLPGPERDRIEQALTLATEIRGSDRRQRPAAARAVHQPAAPRRRPDHQPLRRPRPRRHLCRPAARRGRGPPRHPRPRPQPPASARGPRRAVREPGRRTGSGRDQPRARTRAQPARATPRARRGQPRNEPLGAGHQSLRLHRVGLIHTTGPKLKNLARKYAPLVPVLAGLIARPDTPLSDHAKKRVLDQFTRAQQRFAAITPAPGTADTPG